jgi:hypothetical protein
VVVCSVVLAKEVSSREERTLVIILSISRILYITYTEATS